nr:uncharacterized protein LOC109160617 [Ipomoea trifida]
MANDSGSGSGAVNSTNLVELVDDFQTCCLANYVVRPKEVEVWTIGAAVGVDEEELELSGEEYDEGSTEGSTEGSDYEDDLQFDKFIDANVEYGGVEGGVESNTEETEERRQQGLVGENVDLSDDREIMDSDNELQEDMWQAVGNESVEVGSGGVNEAVNEAVLEAGNLVEIQVNIEGENEIVNEGQTVNELVNAIEDGLEGQTENEAANQSVKDSYDVQEDECTNLADPLLETWDAIQIPWDVFENTQEPPFDNTQTEEETSCGNAKEQGLQVNDHGVKLSYGPPPKKKKKKEQREESQPHAVSEKGTRKKKSLGLTRKYATRSRFKTRFHNNSNEPIQID